MEVALLGIAYPPALATFNNQLFMAWKGLEFDERLFFSSYNGTSWAAQQQIPGVWSSTGPALAVFQNKLYMAWKGMGNDQSMWWTSFNGATWAAQQQIPGVASSTGPRLAVFNNTLYMAWKGMEDDQRLWWTSFNGTTWAAQQLIPGWSSVGAGARRLQQSALRRMEGYVWRSSAMVLDLQWLKLGRTKTDRRHWKQRRGPPSPSSTASFSLSGRVNS